MNWLMSILADASTSGPTSLPTTSGSRPGLLGLFDNPILPIGIGLIFLMFIMNRGKKTDEKKKQELLNAMKKGDKVQTIGGIQGTVTRVDDDKKRVEVKVDESSNTKIWFARNAIARVMDGEGAAETK